MKKVLSLILAFCAFGLFNLYSQDLDEILDNYYEVMGMEKVLETNTMIATGKIVQMGMELPMSMFQKRPGKVRMEAEIQGAKFIQAYDGETGWAVMPWTGTTDPQDMSEDQIKSMKEMGDMEGELYNWEEKGHTLVFEGEDEMEGTEVYKLKLTKESGDVNTYYIDAENFVILKVNSKMTVQGAEVESSSFYSNFKPVEGMIMPFSIESRMNDQVQMQIVIEEYKIDEELDDSLFSKPASSEE